MGAWLAAYESELEAVTDVCADPWFSEQLAAYRAGDEQARLRISGSCLRLVLDIAKRTRRPECPLSVLSVIEEGNAVLLKTIRRFSGRTAQDFIRELTAKVEHRLTLLIEHPGLLG